jgi:hypothetical protein
MRTRKRKFSSFRKDEAFQYLGLTDLCPWEIDVEPIQPSDFFQEHLARLNRNFDLESYEESRKLLIDAICDEGINACDRLKIWKGAQLESDRLAGYVDYLVAERKRFLDKPLLCIIEAQKDDFEQGLAQCLVEMQACQWNNQQKNYCVDGLGIVTNGDGWRFYKLTVDGKGYETPLYSIGGMAFLLGRLRLIFHVCEENLP